MKKYILATFALMAMCISAMAETPSNAFQLNFKDATDSVVVMLKYEPSYEFSADGTQMTVYKGTTALGAAHSVSNVASLMYVNSHEHTLTMVADTIFSTEELPGRFAYWECTGIEGDPACHLYFADSLGTDTIGDATALAAWLAGDGVMPVVYNDADRYVIVTTNDTVLVANTKYLSEVTNVTVEGINSLLLIFREGTASIHAGDTIVFADSDLQSVKMRKGKDFIIKGTAKRTGDIDVNWVRLWDNGPKFAEYNVGVTDGNPESAGGYYTWGGNVDINGATGTQAYNTGTDVLSGADDTATSLWGENWRMPTKEEFLALIANCDVEYPIINGVNCRKYTGRGEYSGNSIVIPFSGAVMGGKVVGANSMGYMWSSTPYEGSKAIYFYFNARSQNTTSYDRSRGCSVRAVLVEE